MPSPAGNHILTPRPDPQGQTEDATQQDEGDELLAAVASAPEAPAPTPAQATDELEQAEAPAAQPQHAAPQAASRGSKLARPPSRPSSRPSSACNAAGSGSGGSRPASRSSSQAGSRPGSRPTSRSALRPAEPTSVSEALKNLAQAQPVDPVADLNVIRAAAAEGKDSLEVGGRCRLIGQAVWRSRNGRVQQTGRAKAGRANTPACSGRSPPSLPPPCNTALLC